MNNESTHASPNAVAEQRVDRVNIPEALCAIDNWVCFQYRPRPGKEKPAKCPINPRTGVEASATAPSTWGTLAEALAALNRSGSTLDGIGFVLTESVGITVLDPDACVSPDGTIQPEILALVNGLATYTEYSPSREGLHIWLFGTPRRPGARVGGIEVYHGKHYITVTGNRVDGTPPTIEWRDEQLNQELDRLAVSSSTTPTKHGVVIPHSVRRPTEAELPLLLDGDLSPVGGDHSLADYWAVRFLGRIYGPDRERIAEAICSSRLAREKWFEKRGTTTYGERTIEKAILDEGWLPTDDHHQRHSDGLTVVEENARWGWGEYPEEERKEDVLHHHQTVPLAGDDERSDKGLCMVPQAYCDFMRTTPTVTDWIVEGFFAPGVITLLEGPPKEAGKTTLLLWIIRSITRGDLFLARKTRRAKVLLVSEQTAETLCPMLQNVGLSDDADLQILLRSQLRGASWQAFTQELHRLCLAKRFELVIIDTLAALAGLRNEDENKSGVAFEVMNALAPLTAEKVAVVATRHERKSGGRTGAAGRGSSAFTGSADLVLSLRPAPGARNHRLLDGIGRFSDAVPVDERIDWQPELGYSKVEPIEVDLVDLDVELLAALGNEEPGRSIPELLRALGKPETTVRRCLDHLQLQGKVRFTEDSRRGRAKRYLLA